VFVISKQFNPNIYKRLFTLRQYLDALQTHVTEPGNHRNGNYAAKPSAGQQTICSRSYFINNPKPQPTAQNHKWALLKAHKMHKCGHFVFCSAAELFTTYKKVKSAAAE
jgi:hypothetical protein